MFHDLKVVELASVLAGPSVGMFFAELGAEVVKIENPLTMGDVTRSWKLPSESRDTDISSYFSSVNWGKKSIAVNAAVPGGREIIYRLLTDADMVIASYKPGDNIKLGLDYKSVRELNPGIIYGHITGYGERDPRAGYDAILQAAAGFTYINGTPESPPTKMPVALIDLLAAHQLKEGLLIALLKRGSRDKGTYVHVSLLQSGIASLANQAANWLVAGEIPRRIGSEHPNIYPYGASFTTRDNKEVILGIGNDRQFKGFCRIVRRPELAAIPLYATNEQRVRNREKLGRLLSEVIATIDRDELMGELEKHLIPTGGILNMREVFDQEAGKEMMLYSPSGNGRPLAGVRTIAFSGEIFERKAEIAPPPHLNEHAVEILSSRLGLPITKIEQLQREGAILWK